MKRIRRLVCSCVLTACLTLTAAFGAEAVTTDAAQAPEFDGYLVRIDPDASVSLLSASEPDFPEMTEVYAPAGAYQVEDADALKALRDCGALIDAAPNYIVTLDDAPVVSDDAQAVLLDASETQWYEAALGLDWVRGQGFRGQGVRVGVVDSGIFKDHEEFQGVKILEGENYCVPKNDPDRHDVSDKYGHGTFVSGLIAAAANGVGIVGIAPDVEIVPLKCFEGQNGSVLNIASAIYDAVDTWHCQVLNLSLGLVSDHPALRAAIEYADEAGVVMVAAVGNAHSSGDPLNYPAAYPGVIGVGAVGSSLSVTNYSCRNESVEICAPGGLRNDLSWGASDQRLLGPSFTNPTEYARSFGTSYASPMVTAAAALALSARPDLTKAEVRALLLDTVRDAGETGYDTAYGYGILHAGRLLAAATGNLAYQTEVIRAQRGQTLTLFAAAYGADGAFLAARDVSSDADEISDETFHVADAASWKLFQFDRAALTPAGASVTLYGPVADTGEDSGPGADTGEDSGPGADTGENSEPEPVTNNDKDG